MLPLDDSRSNSEGGLARLHRIASSCYFKVASLVEPASRAHPVLDQRISSRPIRMLGALGAGALELRAVPNTCPSSGWLDLRSVCVCLGMGHVELDVAARVYDQKG